MRNAEKETLAGVVVFLRAAEGSKSEGVYPFLYQGREAGVVKIKLKGDNPFENKGFCQYDGQRVELTGARTFAGTFVAETVAVLEPPQAADPEGTAPAAETADPDVAGDSDAVVDPAEADPAEFENNENGNQLPEEGNEKE